MVKTAKREKIMFITQLFNPANNQFRQCAVYVILGLACSFLPVILPFVFAYLFYQNQNPIRHLIVKKDLKIANLIVWQG